MEQEFKTAEEHRKYLEEHDYKDKIRFEFLGYIVVIDYTKEESILNVVNLNVKKMSDTYEDAEDMSTVVNKNIIQDMVECLHKDITEIVYLNRVERYLEKLKT